ncbi:MAG: hypothetical protein GX996_05365 [Firmicutes bacterium]|mgnify:CR=1 FL=1|nr:hypothetical protein [Bacillota bacterium]
MARKLFTLLGNSRYDPCRYCLTYKAPLGKSKKMGPTRNDINHAGWALSIRKPKKILRDLEKFLGEAEELILG